MSEVNIFDESLIFHLSDLTFHPLLILSSVQLYTLKEIVKLYVLKGLARIYMEITKKILHNQMEENRKDK